MMMVTTMTTMMMMKKTISLCNSTQRRENPLCNRVITPLFLTSGKQRRILLKEAAS
jgi:hypothetical protein